ncbi:hypothetical protein BAUCODRAFT_29538 [Baudoinia panamericana UAMH 10762]|uniref:Hyaluronan/mRNA-binding protein domain-containing protein n=1 Tax=Baudoinia panamericana (strain UAMH 10762) TaxID=717646 RepID=M2M228_BAUPA|nr:uncharacterized protein BAUCODRAFT_29538 [Baudoinia panamericana UAMH 10762]EMD01138.1 hypothetical protein BAUCODRAFT_29538 [Baudoinia panamericana UAMH 10762]
MDSQIASKNLYELLGNDPELDPDREPEPPTQAVDKPVQRSGKRNAGAEGPPEDIERPAGGGRGGRHEQFTRADGAGSLNNRAEQRDDGLRQDRHPDRLRDPRQHREIGGRGRSSRGNYRGRGRGDYGGTRTARDDRHSRSGVGEHEKQAAHGWGAETGEGELNDEIAGEAIAQAESKDDPGFTPDTAAADPAFSNGPDNAAAPEVAEEAGGDAAITAPAEPEDKTMSYDQYLAEQAKKRLALSGNTLEMRKANEGSKQKFPEGTALQRNKDDENFMSGAAAKARKQKEAKERDTLVLEGQYYAPVEQERGRGGRGRGGGSRGDRGGRGDRGDRAERGDRGERFDRGGGDRGDRGEREFRGDREYRGRGRGRGEYRGEFRGEGRGRGRGGFDGGDRFSSDRGRGRGSFDTSDQSAFPALGGA